MKTLGWICWGGEMLVMIAAFLVSPIAAVVFFAVGDSREGWTMVALLVGSVVYAVVLALELIDRPWTRWKDS